MAARSDTNYADVHHFHTHFGLPAPTLPVQLTQDVLEFRYKFMKEELDEFMDGWHMNDLALMADALIDLVYVAMGTAVMMGLPWQLLWDEVQRKNMAKVKVANAAESKRSHHFDIKKPEGWTPPDIEGLLRRFTERQLKLQQVVPEQGMSRFIYDKVQQASLTHEDPYQAVADELGQTREEVKKQFYMETYGGHNRLIDEGRL